MELAKNLKVIIFDFDGTLHRLELDWAAARNSLETKEEETLGAAVERHKKKRNTGPLDKLSALEDEALSNQLLGVSTKETLSYLKNKYKLAILSRNSAVAIKKFMKKNRVDIDYILGREDVDNLKPHPEGISQILNHFKCSPTQAILIGDTWHDLLSARAAGLNCIIVGDNYSHSTEQPDRRIASLSELREFLN